MISKLLKVCSLPAGSKHRPGLNLKGDYLEKYGFGVGDLVKVTVQAGKIVIEKTAQTELITQLNIKNPRLLEMIEKFELEPHAEV